MKFAYADPPYLGLAEKFYGDLHPEAARERNRRASHQSAHRSTAFLGVGQ